MADKNILEQMLSHLVNDDKQKAEELFHEYVVAKSREIYEGLIEAEMEKDEEDDEDKKVDEASDDEEDDEDKKVDEEFEDIAYEGDDEEMPDMGGDPTDDLEGELGGDEDLADKEPGELFQDLDAIVDELQAKFDAMNGGEEGDEEAEEGFGDPLEAELATVREYVEKVPAGHGAEKKGQAEKADNTKSIVDNMKNDMGGTTANILSSKEEAPKYAGAGGGQLGGTGLEKGKVGDNPDAKGNVNVPGGNAGKTGFKTKEAGHGAEKKGSAESADNKQSLFRGRR